MPLTPPDPPPATRGPNQPPCQWRLGPDRWLDLSRPAVMAILNLTPDSFSDGGSYPTVEAAVEAAAAAVRDGANSLDLGGESTRPGAPRVETDEQIRRVVPVIRAIRAQAGPLGEIPITVDTTRAEVAAAALDAGADAINDVSAGLEDEGMLSLAAARGVGVVLMHRLRPPGEDSYSDRYQKDPVYPGGVVAVVREFLAGQAAAAEAAGVARGAIVLDPGLGFGKTVEQNLELIRRTGEIAALGYPVLSGLSRKSFVGRAGGHAPDDPPRERAAATVGLSVAHLLAGASIFRVHDVGMHARALRAAATAWGKSGRAAGEGTAAPGGR